MWEPRNNWVGLTVDEFSILGNISAEETMWSVLVESGNGVHLGSLNCGDVSSIRAKIVEKFCNTLFAIRVCSEGVDDPDLSQMNSCCQCS